MTWPGDDTSRSALSLNTRSPNAFCENALQLVDLVHVLHVLRIDVVRGRRNLPADLVCLVGAGSKMVTVQRLCSRLDRIACECSL